MNDLMKNFTRWRVDIKHYKLPTPNMGVYDYNGHDLEDAWKESARQKQQEIAGDMKKIASGMLSDLKPDSSELLKNQAKFAARILRTQAELIEDIN